MPVEALGKLGFLFEYFNALVWEFLLSILIFIKKPFQIIHGANPPDHIFLIALFYKYCGHNFQSHFQDSCVEIFVWLQTADVIKEVNVVS